MISILAVQKILGIKEKIELSPEEMIQKLSITFFPVKNKSSVQVYEFSQKLKDCFERLNVNIIPYANIFEARPLIKRIQRFTKYNLNNFNWLFRYVIGMPGKNLYIPFRSILRLSSKRKIKKGIAIICLGEQDANELPMQYISSFKSNSIITILDFPKNINIKSGFQDHFDTAMNLFAYHMTNIVIAVNDENWMLYNFNASHPIYNINDKDFDSHILKTLIPKIIAPISPHKFTEFNISKSRFNIADNLNSNIINELKLSGKLFSSTSLYPQGKRIDDLPFRHNFHKLVGKLHMDNRSGMSFGFFAFQLPTKLSPLITYDKFQSENKNYKLDSDLIVNHDTNELFILLELNKELLVMEVPEVWVMTLRSGSNKTNFNSESDLLKLGLINGKMHMEFPRGLKIDSDYKPSFDTKVILAHAIGNAIIASIIHYFNEEHYFAKLIENRGIGLAHWHGYFNPKYIPDGIVVYGEKNLHVSCSSPQSAIYALSGKLDTFERKIISNNYQDYKGDIHIEPHHGINICYPSLIELANYINGNSEITELGNKYLINELHSI